MIDFRLLRHLWYFVAVAEERHFGKAARRLGISQPPLSQQIRILEQSLGVTLFERSRKGVFLTREGAAILNSAQGLLEHAQRLEHAVRDAGAGCMSALTIGSIGTGLFEILPTVMKRAKRQFPELSLSIVEMHSSNALAALQTREIDLAFARLDSGPASARITPVLVEQMVVALPNEHPLARKTSIRLAELAHEDFVLFPRRVSASYFDTIVTACREAGFSPHVGHEASSIVAQMALVGCGVAVSLVPPSAQRFGADEIVFRPLKERISIATVAAVWNPEHCHPLVESIVKMAVEVGRRRTRAARRQKDAAARRTVQRRIERTGSPSPIRS